MTLRGFLSGLGLGILASSAFAQGDPLALLDVDKATTRNFEIVMERSAQYPRPTAKEVGEMVEKLCAQLDKIFVKYAPKRVADETERLEKEAEKNMSFPETDKKPKRPARKAKPDDDAEPDPNRVIPKCKIFIFNDRTQYEAKCRFDGIEAFGAGYSGFFTAKNDSIYAIRSWSLQGMREVILHEATHYYTSNFLPGGGRIFPQWFREGLSKTYEKHYWNDNKLTIAVQPRIEKFDSQAQGLKHLVRFRRYLQSAQQSEDAPQPSPTETTPPPKKARKSKTKEPETPIEPALIQTFLDTQFTPEILASENIPVKNEEEAIMHRYGMYQVLGRFLLVERPELLGDILRQMALWEHANDKKVPRRKRFNEAWKMAAGDNPVTVEEVGRWLQKNQLPFQWTFGDWLDQGESIAGKAKPGTMCLLALSNPKAVPSFTVYPKVTPDFQVGVVLNYIDEKNFGVLAVDADGDVFVKGKTNGKWNSRPTKTLGKVRPVMERDHPYGIGPAFRFQLRRQGNMIAVQINGTAFGTYPTSPKGCCGFFLGNTEGVFGY